jgi:hypothetical protein
LVSLISIYSFYRKINPNIKAIIDSLGDSRARPECIPSDKVCTYKLYLVESGGRLLMVKRFIRRLSPLSLDNVFGNTHTAGFRVPRGRLALYKSLLTRADGDWSVICMDMLSLLASMAPSLCLLQNTVDTRPKLCKPSS